MTFMLFRSFYVPIYCVQNRILISNNETISKDVPILIHGVRAFREIVHCVTQNTGFIDLQRYINAAGGIDIVNFGTRFRCTGRRACE